ncbi:MAG: Bug family tripartite tricarboxylate transporter substrate binding protein [Gemmatimonas sp.]
MRAVVIACALLVPLATSVVAQPVADFYKGKTIQMIVGSDPGGGYDVYARLLSRHITRFVPGNPGIVVQNMPGAGSIKATNYVYNVAPQDGTVILAPNRTPPFVQILGQPGPQFEARKINWLGSLNNEVGVLEVWHTVPVKTIDDARATPVILGVTAPGTDSEVYPTLANNTIGTKFKIVRGYPGAGAIDLATQRGEVQGQSDSFTSMAQRTPDWRDKFTVLAQLSLTRHPSMPDIPLITDFLKPEYIVPGMTVDEARTLWDLMLTQKVMGRPYAVGPGVPADRLQALRAAFHATVMDEQFRAEAEKSRTEILAVDGEEIQAMIAKVAAAPPAVIAKLNDAIKYKGEAGQAKSEPKAADR